MSNNRNKRNVAIIIPDLEGGGAERTASKVFISLSKKKYSTYMIVFDVKRTVYETKGNLINLNIKASRIFIVKLINFIRRIYKLRRIKKQYHIQSSISFLDSANLMNVLSGTGDKIILSIRNYESKNSIGFYRKVHGYFIKHFYQNSHHIIAVSQGVREDLITNYGMNKEKIQVIYNFYDLEKIKMLAAQEIEEEYREIFRLPVIINMGRLTKQKGQWHLIRAFNEIKKRLPEIKLLFLGKGELEDTLRKMVYDLKLEKDVYFLGFRENPFKYISRSTLFVLTSLYEGFPNALIEAMACGIPVISSDCDSGPREILAPETNIKDKTTEIEYCNYGVLTPVCNSKYLNEKHQLANEEKLLLKSILKLLSSEKLLAEYAEKSLDRAADFEKKKIIFEYEQILD